MSRPERACRDRTTVARAAEALGPNVLGVAGDVTRREDLGTPRAQTHFGSAVTAHARDALGKPLRPRLAALLGLQQALVFRELSIADFGELYAQALVASPTARAGWLSRSVDHEVTLRAARLPIHVAHGRDDAILLPKATEDLLRFPPHATVSWYEGAGHAPHWEDPKRFDQELRRFVQTLTTT